MSDTFDSIVIGGGIAGLLTALRLARGGHAVALVEADRLGSGATSANHGMVHSGALYVRQHGHVVTHCQQAHAAFSTFAAEAELAVEGTLYIVAAEQAAEFLTGLDRHGIAYRPIPADQAPEVDRAIRDTHRLIAVGERVFSSRRIVAILAAQCLAASVTILSGTSVAEITHTGSKVTGVRLAAGHLHARHVVVAAGAGTAGLLSGFGSRQASQLRSRLDMMIHLPDVRLRRGLIFPALDRPVLMPALGGGVLASFFGSVQPQISGRRAFGVDLTKVTRLLGETLRALTIADPRGAVGYVAGKTDYVGTAHAERGMINPGYHMIDHHRVDEPHGLYTVITGKMTLAFHASKAVAEAILGTHLPLVLARAPMAEVPTQLLAVEPWADPAAI